MMSYLLWSGLGLTHRRSLAEHPQNTLWSRCARSASSHAVRRQGYGLFGTFYRPGASHFTAKPI